MMSFVDSPAAMVPTTNAATSASAPMCTGSTVASRKIATSATMEMTSTDMGIW